MAKKYDFHIVSLGGACIDAYTPLLEKFGFKEHEQIVLHWRDIVGAEIAACCKPVRFRMKNKSTISIVVLIFDLGLWQMWNMLVNGIQQNCKDICNIEMNVEFDIKIANQTEKA